MINNQRDMKLRQFNKIEINVVLKKIRTSADFD